MEDKTTKLLELASEHISYWEGEGIGAYIEADIDRNDYESLEEHLKESAKIMFELEYTPEPIEMTDDDLDTMGKELYPNAIWIDRSSGAPF